MKPHHLLPALVLAAGCAQKNLQYDFGRAYTTAMIVQADRGRPSAADAAYPLTGPEGVQLRMRVTESTTDEESGEAEATRKVSVQ
ncbi:MAG: hypothetical protein JNM72_22600 [Deltaproteobacteria bacterium]|jgi:hypothetical protein|nr:hypothetical protein [Deltaproteobacteria bacterium]